MELLPTANQIRKVYNDRLQCFPTGSFFLNLTVGKKDPKTGEYGIPSRTIMEFYGWPTTGKTLLAESLVSSVLKRDPEYEVIWIASEEPDFDRFFINGHDMDRIRIWSFVDFKRIKENEAKAQAENAKNKKKKDNEAEEVKPAPVITYITSEEGLDAALYYIANNPNVKGIVIDSLKALVSIHDTNKGKEVKEMIEAKVPAVQAQLMGKFLGSFLCMNNSNAWLCMLNQSSESIGPIYGFTKKTPAGRLKEFLSFLRIKCLAEKLEGLVHGLSGNNEHTGFTFFHNITKNKHCGPEMTTTSYFEFRRVDMETGEEISPARWVVEREIADLAGYLQLVELAGGGWYTLPNGDKVQGRDKFEAYLLENPEYMEEMKRLIETKRDILLQAAPKKTANSKKDLATCNIRKGAELSNPKS